MSQKPIILFCCALLVSSLQVNATEEELKLIVPATTTSKESVSTTHRPTPPLAASAKSHFESFTGTVTGAKVRLRTSPTLESHVVRETINGELFAVVGETNEYYAVSPPKGTKGYVFRTFILDGTVEGERVNVRLYPDIDAPVIAQFNTGDKVVSTVSDVNAKWLAVDLPENCRFYIAKEYIEKKGGADLIATIEKKRSDAAHHLSAASLFAQAEIQKPFEQIDLDKIHEKFEKIAKDFHEVPSVVEQVREANLVLQDVYVQKKVAFLEGRSDPKGNSDIDAASLKKLAKLGIELKPVFQKQLHEAASSASSVIGMTSPISDEQITDKMLAWQPLEESVYHLWAAANSEKTMEEFYAQEVEEATVLSGIIEPYNRPVKNRPGDFVLKSESLPVAFLYSTKINLEKYVGQKVTLIAAPRPNHNFAFPAYFVINIE